MNRWTPILWAAFLLLASGCARQPVKPVDDWAQHRAAASELTQWTLSGKLGARLPENSGSARLRWKQTDGDYRIDLSGPFGQGRVIIETTDTGVRLRQGGEAPISAHSAEQLLWQTTGWRLPVEQLIYWVRGIPAPDSHFHIAEHTEAGLVRRLTQSGWELTYDDYQNTSRMPLPGRIRAENGDTRLTLIVYDWGLTSP